MERERRRNQNHCDLFMQIFMVALWLSYDLWKTGFIKLNGKTNLWYTAAIAQVEDASEREAALACPEARCCFNLLGLGKWWILEESLRDDAYNRLKSSNVQPLGIPMEMVLRRGVPNGELGGTPAKDHEWGSNKILGKASRAEQAEEVRKEEEEEKEREGENKKEKKNKRGLCFVRRRLCAKYF